jgi:glycosyltransferase involved in cell wall biosynthesis
MVRVAFATPGVLPILLEKEGTVYGGSELRAWRFARGLADLGFQVSIVTDAATEPISAEVLGPVSIVVPPSRRLGLAQIRRLFGRPHVASHDAWQSANADVYLAFGVAEYNASLAEWCRDNHRPLLLFAGSDIDFSSDYRPDNRSSNAWGNRCDRCYDAIVKATVIAVQTETQRRLLKENFGRDAVVIANPVVIDDELDVGGRRNHVLWIGKADSNKRPDLVLAVARACPTIRFRMIANKVDDRHYQQLLADAPRNVTIVESVRPSKLREEFAGAIALLCTSMIEGFPNTFLDAGSFGVPVLSLNIDPDGMLSSIGGGVLTNGDLAALIQVVKKYAADQSLAEVAGKRLREYVRRRHDSLDRVGELSTEIRRLAEGVA